MIVKLEDVILDITNGTTEKQDKEKKGIPVTRIETISDEFINLDRVGYIKNPKKETIEKYRLQKGDILLSNINSDPHLGKTAIYNLNNFLLLHGMNLLRIRPNIDMINPYFLNYYKSFAV